MNLLASLNLLEFKILGGESLRASHPNDRKLDSYDLSPVLKQREPVNYGREVVLEKPELYHRERDISEAYDVADQHPDVVERLLAMIKAHEADIETHQDMLAIPLDQ